MLNCRLTRRTFLAQTTLAASFALLGAENAATVYGRVRFRNGKPGAGLTVVVGPRFNYTDIEGHYRILRVPFGQYTMEIRQGSKKLKQTPLKVGATLVQHDEIL
jgi:hypothetical protein